MLVEINGLDNIMSYYKYMKQVRNRKYVSKEGREYQKLIRYHVQNYMKNDNIEIIDYPIELKLTFYFKYRRRRDLDNCAKVIMDSLEKVLYTDDTNIYRLICEKKMQCEKYKIIIESNKYESHIERKEEEEQIPDIGELAIENEVIINPAVSS